MKKKSMVFIAYGILILFVVTPLVYTYFIRETPPIIPSTYDIIFYTSTASGSIIFDSITYTHGNSIEVSDDIYSITANIPSGYEFDYWSVSDNIVIINPNVISTNVIIYGNGNIKVWFIESSCTAYDEMINDCESLDNVSVDIGTVCLSMPHVEGDKSISFAFVDESTNYITTDFQTHTSTNYEYISFSYFILNEMYYDKLTKVIFCITNLTSMRVDVKSFYNYQLVVGWNNLTCLYDEFNLDDDIIDSIEVVLIFSSTQSHIPEHAYCIDNIFRHYVVCP